MILVFNATGGASQSDQLLLSPEEQELITAERELARFLTIYSEQNPKVKALRARIATLRETLPPRTTEEGEGTANVGRSMLDIQLSELDTRADQLRKELAKIDDEVASIRAILEEIPRNTVALEDLERDYENIQAQYNRAVASASTAATGERIEVLAKGERIVVLSQPVVPRSPSSPNRKMIAAGSLLAGIFAGIGFIVLLELLNGSIRRPVDLTRTLGITPIATLPVMRTPWEVAARRGIVVSVIVGGAAVVVVGVFYLHTNVVPLDVIAARAMNQIGL